MKLFSASAFKHTDMPVSATLQEDTSSFLDQSILTSPVHPLLTGLKFKHGLRKYQNEILDLVKSKLQKGEKDIHVVAPPGAGKTIIGLQIISQLQRPALILCPNTTIQSQWSDKLSLFLPKGMDQDSSRINELIGTHESKPLKPITVLTYQALSIPGKEQEYLEQLAHKSWVKELTGSRKLSYGEAELRILEIRQNNNQAYKKEIGRHLSRLRKNLSEHLDLNEVLHKNALEMVKDLRRQGVEVVIFDECHHLTDYWAAIMHHILKSLDEPVVVALTGTPPEGKSGKQESRYAALCGKADYQVPTPALVREGGLSPFQDLVYFVEPSANERIHFEKQTRKFYEFVERMLKNTSFVAWMKQKLIDAQKENFHPEDEEHERIRQISESILKCAAANVESELAQIARDKVGSRTALPQTEDFLIVLEEYASAHLKLSSLPEKQADYFEIKHELGKLGYGITEGGLRRRASVQDRILAFSTSKFRAAEKILSIENESLKEYLRAIIVTDFERMSATTSMTENYLEEEVGGAIGVLKHLINSPVSESLNPCMVTGSIVLIDSRIADSFLKMAKQFLKEQGNKELEIEIKTLPSGKICQITSTSAAWESRLYVGIATRIFEKGLTKCLIGTRALFGEGWDSQELNTLIDLTTTTASVSVNQLRGRSIRIKAKSEDPRDKTKVANNWDVVCVAPDIEKGLNDYERFARKHTQYYGIADDGQIEKGVGHVHPALSEISDDQLLSSYLEINRQMSIRAINRDKVHMLWKVGQAYQNQTVSCLDIQNWEKEGNETLLAPHLKFDLTYAEHCKQMRRELNGMFFDALAIVTFFYCLSLFFSGTTFLLISIGLIALIGYFTVKRYHIRYRTLQDEILRHFDSSFVLKQICMALLSSLKRMKLVSPKVSEKDIILLTRSSRELRVYLNGNESDARVYVQALKELLSPPSAKNLLAPHYQYLNLNQNNKAVFRSYLSGRMELNLDGYFTVPSMLARSAKGRKAFEEAWNKRVSPGAMLDPDKTRLKGQFYSNSKMKVYERWIWQ